MKDIDMYLIVTNMQSPIPDTVFKLKVPIMIMVIGVMSAIVCVIVAQKFYLKEEKKMKE